MTNNSSLALRTLEYLINKYENELVEKERKIDLLLIANREITYSTKSREYNQQQLYKEDFKTFDYCINCGNKLSFDRCITCGWKMIIDLKDNSLYDKLPVKENK
ncbi:hypothetical protein SKUN_001251 [Spiroplasma kunkelii CR2-3x]|uniref:Uncharacterized protein n=1 Tax=Spiroplasma kunkelii CR2-3x TaxID=273035 RepID=A0A0K2JIR3_SPIKU|nr:hypothetical protein [Spiroplasma kunkelii]ALA98126.1 hypothetical protein SKUN_001251 [Spiroplasma kunkelii CR2-3x]